MASSSYAGDVSDEDKQPRKKLDKGKGKMVMMPELPEDVWRRVFQLWYDDLCEGWQSTGQMVDGVTPLLISRSTSQVATAVLYAHPHLSEGRLHPFIDNVQKPCPYLSLNSKVSLVHHLTVRPTPIREKKQEEPSYRIERQILDTSLPNLTRLFPTLNSFVLRDCLIQTQADAITLFSSLPHMKPQKARLEIRMWALADDAVGRDLRLATNFGTHGFSRPNPDRSTGSHGGAQREWRDAVYADRDMELPGYWLDPEVIHRATNAATNAATDAATNAALQAAQAPLLAGIQPVMAIIDVAAPHSLVDPQNPTGPRIQIPVAGMSPLRRAIELCRDVYRTDFARTSVPTDHQLWNELVRSGPFRPQMTRNHAASVLRRLGHHLPVDAPEVTDLELVKRANLWADSARESAIQAARRGTPAIGSSNNNAAGPSSHIVPSAENINRNVQEEKWRRIKRRADLHARRAMTLAGERTGHWNTFENNQIDGPQYPSLDIRRSDVDNQDETLFQEALRRSRQHAEMLVTGGEASSSMSQPLIADNTTSPSTSNATPGISASQSNASSEVVPPVTQAPLETISRLASMDSDSDDTDSDADVRVPPLSSTSWDRLYDEEQYASMLFTGATATGTTSQHGDMYSHMLKAMAERGSRDRPRWLGTESATRQPAAIEPPQAATADYHAENAIGPGEIAETPSILVDDMLPRDRSLGSQYLACAMRRQLLHLIENTWSPKLQAFSLVTLDPLAALIALAPELDLWINVAIPHIRVQLPRGVNSLSIFKGTREHTRDRARAAMLNLRAAQDQVLGGLFGAVAGANANTNRHTGDLRSRYPLEQVIDPIVGGDGSGGGLVHPETRLFEVEVNTVREMTDESWYLAGAELPPQVCRILTGAQDWSEVGVRANVETRQEDVGFPSPKTNDYASPQYYGSDGMFDSDDEGGSMDGFDLDGEESAGEGYDAEAARAQAERIAQRKRDRAAQDTAE